MTQASTLGLRNRGLQVRVLPGVFGLTSNQILTVREVVRKMKAAPALLKPGPGSEPFGRLTLVFSDWRVRDATFPEAVFQKIPWSLVRRD